MPNTSLIKIKQDGSWIDLPALVGRQGEQGNPGPAGPGVPAAGTTGQILLKKTNDDYDTEWGNESVSDVQVNGTSVVTNGIANVPRASASVPGVVRTSESYGTKMSSDGALILNPATDSIVKSGTNALRPLPVSLQHAATFYGLAKAAGDSTQSLSSNAVGTYTDAAKVAIQTMLGVQNGVSFVETITGTTPSITGEANTTYKCGEVSTLTIAPPALGTIDIKFTSGTTATVLTITPPTGVTSVKWPAWFDPTALEASTIYELIIEDSEFGGVMTWAL